MGRREPVELFDVEAIHETDMALLVRFDDDEEAWIPKSLIFEDSEVKEDGDIGTLVIPEWFAEKEGLV